MGIISSSLIGKNLDFAVGNVTTTLTAVTPTNSEVYAANKQDIENGFDLFVDGKEAVINTRSYINKTNHTTLPEKGHILTDGTNNYKVVTTETDAVGVTIKLDCEAQYQR